MDGGVRDEKDYIVANEIPEVSEGGGIKNECHEEKE